MVKGNVLPVVQADATRPPFGEPTRFVTTHNAQGKAVFSPALQGPITTHEIPGMLYYEAYKTFDPAPVNLNHESDIKVIQERVAEEATISFPQPGATILRYCDWPPGGSSPLHRHVTIDFGIVIFGSIEAIMDSGETRMLKAGDVIVQRNTLHAWRNPSDTEWVRVVFVIQGTHPTIVGDKVMGEDLEAFGS
ncbi:oxalate oxidase GF-3.8 [Podospora aff. communis PSN243]|uniref:Oxalate oxidase GF-3.8 n=1 Tax=Podospora aff. communis PSN243 TaxID=3040156 RepID=A0AAV9G4R2_9PEZI|nr:oxalate oxidase GF-3.8 [Podospora aff. communis PSN243]